MSRQVLIPIKGLQGRYQLDTEKGALCKSKTSYKSEGLTLWSYFDEDYVEAVDGVFKIWTIVGSEGADTYKDYIVKKTGRGSFDRVYLEIPTRALKVWSKDHKKYMCI